MRQRAFVAFVAGYAVSTFGNYVNLVALNLYVYHLTGSALQMGVVMAVRLTAGFLAGPVAGVLATRHDRRVVMIAADIAQAGSMILLLSTPPAGRLPVLYVVAVVLGAGNTLFTVGLRTSVPDLVGAAERVRGNGYLITGKSVAMVLGFASAGPMIGAFGFSSAFAVNAGSFVVSAVVLAFLPLSFRTAPAAAAATADGVGRAAATADADGVRRGRAAALPRTVRMVLVGSPILGGMVMLRGVDAWASSSHNVALPILASAMNPGNPAMVLSRFWTAWAVGMLLTHGLVSLWLRRSGRSLDERAFAGAACVMSVAFVAVFTGPPGPLMLVIPMVAGLADGVTELAYNTRLQQAPEHVRGKLFGLSATTETSGFGVGMLTSAAALEQTNALAVVATFHAVVIVATGAFLLLLRRSAGSVTRACRGAERA